MLQYRILGLFLLVPALIFANWNKTTPTFTETGHTWNFTYPTKGSATYQWEANSENSTQQRIIITLDNKVKMIIHPNGNTAYADIYILDDWLYYENIKLAIPFDLIMQTQPNVILRSLDSFVDWKILLPACNKSTFRLTQDILKIIRTRLPIMESLNPDGVTSEAFAKWLVDGFYEPQTGKEISYEDLTDELIEKRGSRHVLRIEEEHLPFLGLDWVRNLALKMALIKKDDAEYGDNDVDYLHEFQYLGHTGYGVAELERILYILAVEHSNSFFLGSLNERELGEKDLLKYRGIVILFPVINLRGELEVFVFENGKEWELEAFIGSNEEKRIQLVDILTSSLFRPTEYEPLSVIKR